ncbi:monooxygenase [Actinobacteria bacterium YIM 96077]|uniref:Monooxygenase n=1 Tax=Phytoactinopolyspora halophila TaxID=1981511 RepID=A0A329QB84_9ACTN|nr:FAD-dependent monooxygenase [Phytoactinopolyspora halophila]AYY12634.1 monooxygenase [Actinobacteria bacterium YIM 96077]RAW09507.1 monooxygenase [Phytoactinopolyspora halophila]
MLNFDADVIVVGAGPTGLMLAGELRLAGVETVVLDRLAEPMKQSRALGFSARAIEEFDQRGLLPRFGEVQTIPFGHFGGLPIDYRVLEGGSYGARGKPQSLTESILAAWATELGAVVHRNHEVTGLSAGADGVELDVATPEGAKRLRARYVAGCDGARSSVRKLAGIDFPGTDPTIEMWFADVAGCDLQLRFAGERVPGGMVMVLPLGPEVQRVILYERGTTRPGGDAPSFSDVAAAWNRLTGEDISGGKPLWTSYTTDTSRQAAEYRRGRVFLLGDAAHIHLPIGAQGMSAGIGDAMNLGWKLGAEINGYAPADLLDTYHSERHPVGARVLTNTLAQRLLYLGGEEMDPMREVLAELLAYEEAQRLLVGMVTGLDIRYDVGDGDHPLLGKRLPDVELVGDFGAAGTANAFQFLHAGRGMVLDLADNEKLRKVASPWTDRVDVITTSSRPAGVLEDVDAALVRPDGYIAWIGTGGSEGTGLPEALARWFGAAA